MSMKIQRGIVLLVAALIGLIVGAVNNMNEGPVAVSQAASAAMVFGGIGGLVFVAWGLLGRER